MRKINLIFLVLVTLFLSGCTKEATNDFILEAPQDTPVVLSELPYSDYLKLSNPVATIKIKDVGEIKLQLFADIAPNTVNSFILYAQDGSYDNNSFHRVVSSFVIQGGKIEGACDIPGEMSLRHEDNTLLHYRGVISMARIGNLLDSASSQFFIVVEDAHNLDTQYAGFGGVVDGFEVVDYLASIEVEGTQVPPVDIIIESITIELNGYEVTERICVK